MFSNIENVNILTSVLKSHGVRRVVVCPGSRNAPIVHNLNELEDVTCYPVTDERSAGFMAIGLALGKPYPCPAPVAVCVTSGSAVVNLYPAIVEAYYQKLPVIFISADRPEAWIGQQDGQTMPQANIFGNLVNRSVNLPIITPYYNIREQNDNIEGQNINNNIERQNRLHEEQAWHCERLVHEAIIDCVHRKIGPVHINIPIQEPLYEFNCKQLPDTHRVDYVKTSLYGGEFHHGDLVDFLNAKKPMIVIGQDYPSSMLHGIKKLDSWAVILAEPTALGTNSPDPANHKVSYELTMSYFEQVLSVIGDNEEYMPDFILYVGGNIVSKRLKQFLRKAATHAKVWRASKDGDLIDTFMHTDRIFQCDPDQLGEAMTGFDHSQKEKAHYFIDLWEKALLEAKRQTFDYAPAFSSLATVKYFETEFHANSLDDTRNSRVFYGNSMAIRLGCLFARQFVHCNRGANGIEGTLSTAAGLSIYLSEQLKIGKEAQQKVFCVLGDLSFFYDQNALWNQNLNGSLRIIVLNNGGGAIFGKFKGLKESKAREKLVMAKHQTSAANVCQANDITYLGADNMKTMQYGIGQLIHTESDRPMLLEVFTDVESDEQEVKDFFASLH